MRGRSIKIIFTIYKIQNTAIRSTTQHDPLRTDSNRSWSSPSQQTKPSKAGYDPSEPKPRRSEACWFPNNLDKLAVRQGSRIDKPSIPSTTLSACRIESIGLLLFKIDGSVGTLHIIVQSSKVQYITVLQNSTVRLSAETVHITVAEKL
jgi:hypothetical protein